MLFYIKHWMFDHIPELDTHLIEGDGLPCYKVELTGEQILELAQKYDVKILTEGETMTPSGKRGQTRITNFLWLDTKGCQHNKR